MENIRKLKPSLVKLIEMQTPMMQNGSLVKEIESHASEIVEAFKACKLRSSQAFNMLIDLSKEVFSHLDNGRITRDQFSHLDNILCHHRITVREEVLR